MGRSPLRRRPTPAIDWGPEMRRRSAAAVTAAILALVLSVLIGALLAAFETPAVADTSVYGVDLGIKTGIAFLFGAVC